ncbi:MAG: hypothetical protein J5U19_03810 [Candidatus Methanoperedens sp.]|nr:hypothetical protein [Candidatus Methanoperedens sp.]
MKELQQQRNGTRMTWIVLSPTDTHYPCASASSAQSVFYCTNAIFDDGNKPQMKAPRVAPLEGASTCAPAGAYVSMHCGGHNADERRYFLASEFSKIIHRKGRKERKVHQMISFGIRKTTEGTEDTEKRNKPLCSPWSIILDGNHIQGLNRSSPKIVIFLIEKDMESGFNARALEYSIFMQGETIEEGRENIIDANNCHFDNPDDIITEAILDERR